MYQVAETTLYILTLGTKFDWKYAREFKIGEVVYYIDYFKDHNVMQEHLQWLVEFRTAEGKTYSASQLYFVCEYEWENIVEHVKQE